jgi:hypothetical protein
VDSCKYVFVDKNLKNVKNSSIDLKLITHQSKRAENSELWIISKKTWLVFQ